MSSATNRTERLAKALKDARPDFTLYNARVFARELIGSPEGVFGMKPLAILPREARSAPEIRPGVALPPATPVAAYAARPGDLVAQPGGEFAPYLGSGRVLVADGEVSAATMGPDPHMHPGVVRRPTLPDSKTREEAVESWPSTEFALGVDAAGSQVCWRPAATRSLAVVGRTGSGLTVLTESVLDQARAAGWMTLYASTIGRESFDPAGVPGLVSSSLGSYPADRNARVNEYSAVIEIARRMLQHRRSRSIPGDVPEQWSGSSLLDARTRDVPILLVLDSIDAYRLVGRPDAARGTVEAVWAITDILAHGFDHRIHVLVTSQLEWPEYLPPLWTREIPEVVLTGKRDIATGRLLGLGDLFTDDGQRLRGQMAIITRVPGDDSRKAFACSPFQGYFGGSELGVVPGQYPRLVLDTTAIAGTSGVVDFSALAQLPDVLLEETTGAPK
ncbi:hypothetical protein BKG82_18935 [Mycobacteroides chelonae]|uniref:FtsK domain-containing protein n=1 Tax=Mycobacteroides chelonae TaxID=1774 RepID=A0A1S1LHL4_MYCCH|nr:hypothetical protein BKG82_18935 [Mycobacteroides chelonae]